MQERFGSTAFMITSLDDLSTAISEMQQTGEFHRSRIYIMSNTIMRKDEVSEIPETASVVFDEIHNYRNSNTQLHRGAIEVAKTTRFRIGLSATPINNTLEDLTSEIRILMPHYDWDTVNAVVQDVWRHERNELSLPLMTRFIKEKLGIHFAKRDAKNIRISFPHEYYDWVKSVVSRDGQRRVESHGSFETITLFRLASSSPRAFIRATGEESPTEFEDVKLKTLKQLLAKSKSSHIIAFCEFKETVKLLEDGIDCRVVYAMTGDTPVFDRVTTMEEFREDDCALLIMTSVGSEGLDLQFADTVINYDLHWNPMKIEQRIGRIDRIGQKKEVINVVNFIVDGSIDERVVAVIERKLKLVSGSVLDTRPILGKAVRKQLFDKDTYDSEMARSQKLLEAMNWTQRIPVEDYGLLESVDISLCDIVNLRRAGAEGMDGSKILLDTPISGAYLKQLELLSTRLKEHLQYYS
jgi:superfamily II DNA or RNA helicase